MQTLLHRLLLSKGKAFRILIKVVSVSLLILLCPLPGCPLRVTYRKNWHPFQSHLLTYGFTKVEVLKLALIYISGKLTS